MKKIEIVEQVCINHGGIITTSLAQQHGISRMDLSNLCKEGSIVRITRGQYVLCDDVEDEIFSLSIRSKNIVFSHETALYLHGLSDRTPFVHSVTCPSYSQIPKSIQSVCKTYFIKDDLFELGTELISTPFGNMVKVYDMDRTICDVIRCRNRMEYETFLFALKAYAASKKKNLSKLRYYSEKLRIKGIVDRYMEVLI